MKIKIHAGGRNFTIPIPNGLFMNSFTAKIASKAIKKEVGADFSPEHMKTLFKQVKGAKKILNGAPMLHVRSGSGEEVTITL